MRAPVTPPRTGPAAGALAAMRAALNMGVNVTKARLRGPEALLRPLFISWEINSACNLRCPYCYLHDRSYGFSDRGLPFEDVQRVLRRIRKATPDVMLLGGEPYIHPAWDDIVDFCCDELGLRVRCITNGTLLERHLRTTGRLHLLLVSYDHKRARVYPEQMADMLRQLEGVRAMYPRLQILLVFVLCADDDPPWVVDTIDDLTGRGYNVFVNVDRYFGAGPVDERIVNKLRQVKDDVGRVHMTDRTLDWLADTSRPVPFCNPTLLPLLDPQARLIYPCCYFNEQSAGSLLEMDYAPLLRRSAERFGHYPFEKCSTCRTTAYLDASVAVRHPVEALRHYQKLYNHR